MAEHKYTELANQLRDNIINGVYANGQKLPSENELADQTGYSRQTVRQAIGVLESEGRVERVQGSGTFVCMNAARSAKTYNIAIVTTFIGEYIFPDLLNSIEKTLGENGYTTMLCATRNRVNNERRVLQMLLQKPIDGIIMEGTKTALPNANIDLYECLKEQKIPVVFIKSYYPQLSDAVHVIMDDQEGGRMACEQLIQAGHKKIAGIFKSDDMQGCNRYAGYVSALQNAGLMAEDEHVLWYTTETCENMLAGCLERTLQDCTAVICHNDEITMLVLPILRRLGIRVPEEMEIVSFDHSMYAQMTATPFLSLNGQRENMGRLAAEKLLGLLHGEEQSSEKLSWSI